MSVKVRFPDKTTLEASSWEELENKLREMQFEQFDTNEEFRKAMERRALVWSEEEIEIDGDSRDFLYELSRAQLLDVIPDLGVIRGGRQ